MDGVIYAAYGNHYIARAISSATSLRKHSDCPIVLFTFKSDVSDRVTECFDSVVLLDEDIRNYKFLIKIMAMINSPFDRTIYLDSDTIIIDNFDELFSIYLDNFDIIAPHAFWRKKYSLGIVSVSSSLVGFRKSNDVQLCLEKYKSLYLKKCEDDLFVGDQGFLMQSILQSNVRLMITPPEYHCLYDSMNSFHGRVKIVSCHMPERDYSFLNETENHRVWIGEDRTLVFSSKTSEPESWKKPVLLYRKCDT